MTPGPQHRLDYQISDILGGDYEVIDDLTEEEAEQRVNEILYGDQT